MEPPKRRASDDAGAQHYWVAYMSALTLCCLAFASSVPESAAPAGAAAATSRCAVVEKPRLFVGFAAGMTLDDFEVCAAASRRILSGVRAWLCETQADTTKRALYTRRLHAALNRGAVLRMDEVQFGDAAARRARVVVRDLASTQGRSGWHVQLEPSAADAAQAWIVTRASDARLEPDDTDSSATEAR